MQLIQLVRTFCTEEFARDIESFASDDDDFLAVEQLLGHSTGQTTQEMSLPIDNYLERTPSATTLPGPSFPWMSRLVDFYTYDGIEARHPGMLSRWSGVVWVNYC